LAYIQLLNAETVAQCVQECKR